MASPSCNDAQLREKARKERERIAQSGFRARERMTNIPEFGPIIKEPKANDALHQQIASVLGSYDDKAKAVIQESSNYLGVDEEATTPASPIVTSKGALPPRLTPASLSGKDLQRKRIDLPNGSQRPRNHETKTDFKALIPHNSSSKRHSGGGGAGAGGCPGMNGKPVQAVSHNSKTTLSPGAKISQQSQKHTPPPHGNITRMNANISVDFHKQRTPTSEFSVKQHCMPQNHRSASPLQSSNNNQKSFPSALVDNHNQRTPPLPGFAATEQYSQQNQKFTPPNQNAIASRNSSHKTTIGTSLDSQNHKMPTLSAASLTHQCNTQKEKPDHSPRVQTATKEGHPKCSLTASPDKTCKRTSGHKSTKVRKPLELSIKNVKKCTGSDDSLDLEVIQEMTKVSTPVSDIQTPKKEECTGNIAPNKNDQALLLNGASKEVGGNSAKTEGRVTRCMSEGTLQLDADLSLSSSDSESEAEQINQSEKGSSKNDTRQTNGIVLTKPVSHRQNMALNNDLSDSTSDSSSEGSDTDSSSSSSEDGDVDEHQEDQKKPDDNKSGENWNLKNWIPNTSQPILPVDGLHLPTTKDDIPLLDTNDSILDNLFANITTDKEVSPLDTLDTKQLDPDSHELVDKLLLNGSGPKCDVEDLLSPIGLGTKSTSSQCRSSKAVTNTNTVSSSRNSSSSRTDGADDATGQTGSQKKTPPSQKATASHNLSYNGAKGSVPNKVINSTNVTCNAKSPAAAVQQSPTANKTKKTPTKVATKPALTKRPSSSVGKKSASTKKSAAISDKDTQSISGAKGKGSSKANRQQTVAAEKKPTVANKTPVKRTNQGSKQTNSQTLTKKSRWKSREFLSSCDSSSSLSSSESSSSHCSPHSASSASSSSSSSDSSDSECELDQHMKRDLQDRDTQKTTQYLGRSLDAGSVQVSDHDRTSSATGLETQGSEPRPPGMCAVNSNTSLDLDDELLKAPPQMLSPICATPDLPPGPGLSPRLQANNKFSLPYPSDNKSPVDVPSKEDSRPSIMVRLDLNLIRPFLHAKDASCSSSSVTSSNKLTLPSIGSPGSLLNKSTESYVADTGNEHMELSGSANNSQRSNVGNEDGTKPLQRTGTPSPEDKSRNDPSATARVKVKDRKLLTPSASPANIQHGAASKSKQKTGQEEKAVIASILGTSERSPLSLTIPKRKLQNPEPDNNKKLKTDPKNAASRDSSKHKECIAEAGDKRQSGALRETAKSWGHIAAHFDENPHYHGSKYVERRKGHTVEPLQYRLQPADYYLQEARRLKHEAEGRSQSRISKLMMYLEAVLSFVQCGYAMEKETSDLNNKGVFNMYKETFKFSRDILKGSKHDVDALEYKLIVLSFRLQSLLCLKLFKLKKPETSKLKSIMDEYYRSAASKVPSPCPGTTVQGRPGTTGTPSPMSQQSSPAGSINSVGSGGSTGSDHVPRLLNNGTCNSGLSASNTGAGASNSTVAIPSRIHSVSQSYLTYMDYLYQCHEIWDQADHLVEKCKAFFQDLDRDCKPLSLHSSILEVVRYVKEGIHRLRQTLSSSSSSSTS